MSASSTFALRRRYAAGRASRRYTAGARGSAIGYAAHCNEMIVYHGTTIDALESIKAEGLWPGTYVAPNKALARDYAYDRAITLGADGCVVFTLDVPDPTVERVEAWWWTGEQLLLPLGCTPECILEIDTSDPRPFQAVEEDG